MTETPDGLPKRGLSAHPKSFLLLAQFLAAILGAVATLSIVIYSAFVEVSFHSSGVRNGIPFESEATLWDREPASVLIQAGAFTLLAGTPLVFSFLIWNKGTNKYLPWLWSSTFLNLFFAVIFLLSGSILILPALLFFGACLLAAAAMRDPGFR